MPPRKPKAETPADQSPDQGTPADPAPAAPRQRWVVSHLLSARRGADQRAEGRDRFSERFEAVLRANVDVRSDTGHDAPGGRRVIVFEGEQGEIAAKSRELSADTVVEPELPRFLARAIPAGAVATTAPAGGPGTGASVDLTFVGPGDKPVVGAALTVSFAATPGGPVAQGSTTSAGGRTNGEGKVTVPYDPASWTPALAYLEPAGDYWTWLTYQVQTGATVTLTPLPKNGPFGWWQWLTGVSGFDPDAGRGIRVGIIDSGVGPHPYLGAVTPIGAFLDGNFLPGAEAGLDARDHGTHVSGIIAARPAMGSGEFAGLAPGVEAFMARVFTATGGGNQGDIANAIDALALDYQADIINMSLTGAASAIEHDAVITAFQAGTLCVCAAGNQNGSAVGYPAAYPECVAVSALGLPDTMPADSMPAANYPTQPGRVGMGGLFLASFSNIGPQLLVAAPGNGIVSTVPAGVGGDAPYADMSGTSMASPLTAAALAALASRDPRYKFLPRTPDRALYLKALLAGRARPVGLAPVFEGRGLARAV